MLDKLKGLLSEGRVVDLRRSLPLSLYKVIALEEIDVSISLLKNYH